MVIFSSDETSLQPKLKLSLILRNEHFQTINKTTENYMEVLRTAALHS